MSKSRDALGLVLAGLRELLARGEIAPGAAVSIADVAARFRVSVTPVREALARLAGEGVLRSTRRLGYERPAPGGEELAELYAFREMLLLAAVRSARPGRVETAALAARGTAEIFDAWIALAANGPLAQAYASTVLKLAPATAAKPAVLGDLAREAEALLAATEGSGVDRLEATVRAHHARRSAAAARIAAHLRFAVSTTPSNA